ncbi:GntR family transcriptional regulator [Bacillus massiliigorillae]|uniref:GntR family transcriptional regulator n=1 Tax=Bacillus massiliigorillae TaxID=1243664 RepID=UPI0003A356EE|nr:GntR family transcriptional regulator [Bacillus massiliigorillae]
MKLVLNNREPIYLQVVIYFKQRIAIGELVAGEEIPSRRELAVLLNINPNTVQKAYKEMEDQELIETERNFPSRITKDEVVLQQVRKELIKEATVQFVETMKRIAVTEDEMMQSVREVYKTGELK